MKLIIDVKVSDLNRAVEFYGDTLGFVCRRLENDWAAFKVGDAEIHLFLHSGVTGHVEFYVDDLDQSVAVLLQNDVVLVSGIDKPKCVSVDENNVTTFPWGRAAFFEDSEGNELAFVKDFDLANHKI